jgi:Raf kinase inhibitor-like YbhB/YbcL family protein
MAQAATTTMRIESPAFDDNMPIPSRYSEDGRDVSPPLRLDGVPRQARELVLLVEDPDAPVPKPWVHWLLAKIPASTRELPEGLSSGKSFRSPPFGVEGRTSWGKPGYRGPAPPKGHGTHHYHFRLYALSEPIDLPGTFDKDDLTAAMKGKLIAQADLVGTYER